MPENRLTGRGNRAAVEQYWKRLCDLLEIDAVRPAANGTDLWREVGAGDAEIAAGHGADDEFIAGDVESDGGSGPVPNFDANGRRGRSVALLIARWHVRADCGESVPPPNGDWNSLARSGKASFGKTG